MTSKSRLAIALTLSGVLWGCHRTETQLASAQVLHRALGGEPSTLDPAAAADNFSHDVLRDLYEGLTTESATGEILPGVAASWDIDASGMQYTFRLRSNARWSNGKPVRAQDFVAAWRRVVDPRQGSPVADNMRLIAGATAIINGTKAVASLGVSALSDSILMVRLEQPAPYLPQLLTNAAAYPIYSIDSAASHNPARLISNGPYILSSWSPGTTVELSRNPAYWDHANVPIPRVQYQVVSDENSQFARYRAGQLDMTDTVPANAMPALRAAHSAELVISPFLATGYYGFNLSSPSLGSSIKLRRALSMAIDRKRLVNALGFGQAEAYGFVPPGTWNYRPQAWAWKDLPDAERIAEAKQLYAQAGYSNVSPLHLRLLFNTNPSIRNTAIIVAGMWKDTLGIETALTEEEYRVFLQSRHDKSRWEIARLGWTADYNDASNFLDIFREHSSNNDPGYANPSFDALLDQAAHTPDSRQRSDLLEAGEKMMLADYPIVPLYFFVSKRLVKPYLKGYQSNPLNRVGSKTLRFAEH
jgi:oligopeptide transport system substrate-binding protein